MLGAGWAFPPRILVVLLIGGDVGLGVAAAADPPVIPPGPCAPEDVVRAAVLSDRLERMVAVVESAHAAASPSTCFEWHLFTTDAPRLDRLLEDAGVADDQSGHSMRVSALAEAEASLEERGVTPVWLRPGFRSSAESKPRRTPWSLRERTSDSDPKHAHPLNLLRFYLPQLPAFEGVDRLLLLDDDVCVRGDLRAFFAPPAAVDAAVDVSEPPALIASCQMQHYDREAHHFAIGHARHSYADTPFLGSVGGPSGYALCAADVDDAELQGDDGCDPAEAALIERRRRAGCAPAALEPKLVQLHREISDGPEPSPETADAVAIAGATTPLRNATAWNFGVALVQLERWRRARLDLRFERWFVANEHFAFFAPTSVSFGLGLAYLALSGHVGCWPAPAVIDALGFLTWDDLQANGIGQAEMQVRAARMHVHTCTCHMPHAHATCTCTCIPPADATSPRPTTSPTHPCAVPGPLQAYLCAARLRFVPTLTPPPPHRPPSVLAPPATHRRRRSCTLRAAASPTPTCRPRVTPPRSSPRCKPPASRRVGCRMRAATAPTTS